MKYVILSGEFCMHTYGWTGKMNDAARFDTREQAQAAITSERARRDQRDPNTKLIDGAHVEIVSE